MNGSSMATFGVSDFLCHDELEMGDLVLHTKFPRVDCIHGGVCPPPRAGLAVVTVFSTITAVTSRELGVAVFQLHQSV